MKNKKGSMLTDNMGKLIIIMVVLLILLTIIWVAIKPRLSGGLDFLPGM